MQDTKHQTLSKQSWEHNIPALRAEGKGVSCPEISAQFMGYNLDTIWGDSR